MYTTDARKLSRAVHQKLIYYLIKLLEQGKSRSKTINLTGVSLSSIKKWWKIYKTKGLDGLRLKKRGAKLGNNRKLNEEQTNILEQILIKTNPDRMGLNFSLWTRQAIQNLVFDLWGIQIALRTITDYMKRLGFTPQKPIKLAYEQNPKLVEKWLKEDYPDIAKKAKKENAEIHWLDETGLSSYSNYLRGYSPKGKTPVLRMQAKRLSLNIISSISKLGKMRFMTYKKSLNTKVFIKFVSRLCKDVNRKIFVILDNLAVHHSKIFTEWVNKREDKIRVFYLPPFSPELNPDERLNRDLKTHFHSGALVKDKKELRKKIVNQLRKIQKMPSRIKNYFRSDYVKYAA